MDTDAVEVNKPTKTVKWVYWETLFFVAFGKPQEKVSAKRIFVTKNIFSNKVLWSDTKVVFWAYSNHDFCFSQIKINDICRQIMHAGSPFA